MSYEAVDRVLSISFAREPEEYADALFAAGQRMFGGTNEEGRAWGKALGTAIGFGAVVGIVMELYRRFILPLMLDTSEIAPLRVAAVEMLPFFLLITALVVALYVRALRRQRRGLISRLRPGIFIDVDIFSKGLILTTGQSIFEADWSEVRDVVRVRNGMEIECELSVIFIPERAFANRAAFNEAGKEIRNVWRRALKRERDSKMVAASFD